MYSPQHADKTVMAITQFDPCCEHIHRNLLGQKLPHGVILSLASSAQVLSECFLLNVA
jgi:hypothetical protein